MSARVVVRVRLQGRRFAHFALAEAFVLSRRARALCGEPPRPSLWGEGSAPRHPDAAEKDTDLEWTEVAPEAGETCQTCNAIASRMGAVVRGQTRAPRPPKQSKAQKKTLDLFGSGDS